MARHITTCSPGMVILGFGPMPGIEHVHPICLMALPSSCILPSPTPLNRYIGIDVVVLYRLPTLKTLELRELVRLV